MNGRLATLDLIELKKGFTGLVLALSPSLCSGFDLLGFTHLISLGCGVKHPVKPLRQDSAVRGDEG